MRSGFLAYVVMLAAVLGGLSGPFGGRALGQTTVGGVISTDTTWTLDGSPYTVEETIELIGGAVLTIEPGVEVAFEAGTALDSGLGVLIADGLGGSAIVLRSASGEVGDWQGVVSSLDVPAVTTLGGEYVSGPIFRNVRIVEAVRAVEVGPTPNYFEGVEIERCQESGVYFVFLLEEPMWMKGLVFRDAGMGMRFRGGSSSRLVLHDCHFEDNASGGLVMDRFTSPGNGELLRCVFRGNGSSASTRDDGVGGARLKGSWDVRACLFEQNVLNDSSVGGGGLALDPVDATIIDCDFLSNTARASGGGADVRQRIAASSGSVRVERCRFIGNTSMQSSGAGLLAEVPGGQFEVEILGCTFEDNHGDRNGGLAVAIARGVVAGNTFERNSAVRSGGAVRIFRGSDTLDLVIRDNEFLDNTTDGRGGGIDVGSTPGGVVRIESNAFRGNAADIGGAIGGVVPNARIEVVGNAFEGNVARLGGAVNVTLGTFQAATLAAEGDLRNRFTGNTADLGDDIYNDARVGIDATGNCWGTDDLMAIAERIYDAADDPTKGAVAFDPIATECGCPADLDGDGSLTIFDFLAFQNLFDLMDPAADFDGDGEFTIFDFLAFQNAFDAGCP
ncbi:MAG: right-handed parallel beta-helix repeat-containing protein [Phycisphaera sp.]|nr:MAG: right-handed parallel beta-helix repeat-containing protein [Phycisphaera sp.]